SNAARDNFGQRHSRPVQHGRQQVPLMRKLMVACIAAYSIRVFAVCPTQPPQLVAPPNGATNVASPAHFDWNDVPNATSYRVWASFNGGAANIIALTTDSQYDIDVPAGPVDWWVDALGGSSCPT